MNESCQYLARAYYNRPMVWRTNHPDLYASTFNSDPKKSLGFDSSFTEYENFRSLRDKQPPNALNDNREPKFDRDDMTTDSKVEHETHRK